MIVFCFYWEEGSVRMPTIFSYSEFRDYFQHTSCFFIDVTYTMYLTLYTCALLYLSCSDAGADEEGQSSPTANATSSTSSSSSSTTTSPTSPKGEGGAKGEPMASRGAGPTANQLLPEHGTHKKKTRDRIQSSPNLIRKKKEVYIYTFI